jgi:ATP-dependent Clp protease protease subunit
MKNVNHYISGEIWEGTTSALMERLNSLKEDEQLTLIINSGGGYLSEGLAMYDLINTSERVINTIGIGTVGSAATFIFLAGEKRLLSENAEFFIHNPYIDPFYLTGGEAKDYEEVAELLRKEEERLKGIYSQFTTKNLDELLNNGGTYMSAKEAIEAGFATGIYSGEEAKNGIKYKIAAKQKGIIKNQLDMSKQLTLLERIANLLEGKGKAVKAAIKETAEGVTVYFEGEEIIVGQTILYIDEAMETTAPDGNHTIDDVVYRTEGGLVVEIVVEDESLEEIEALREENAKLKALLEEAQNELKKLVKNATNNPKLTKTAAGTVVTKQDPVNDEGITIKGINLKFRK